MGLNRGDIENLIGLEAKVDCEKTTHAVYRTELDGNQLRKLLGIPANARVYVQIPGGGDYSNTDMDIDSGFKLKLVWERRE